MTARIAIIAPGAMGSAVGARLVEHGLPVCTVLDGRTAASAERAHGAGMTAVPESEVAETDLILSILPPGQARALAERLAPTLQRAERKPVYVDCNAVSPETVRGIAQVIDGTGCAFVDSGIIGGPPKPGDPGPAFYASGAPAGRFAEIAGKALRVELLDGPVGAASALKMSYAGITKGLTALGATMMLAAQRGGAAEALHRELASSQPMLLAWLSRSVPGMYSKAYRWVAEMQEIEAFVGEDPAGRKLFAGAAAVYEQIAQDHAGERKATGSLQRFIDQA